MDQDPDRPDASDRARRRDLLGTVAVSMAAIGAGAFAWPFAASLVPPDAAPDLTILRVPLGDIPEGARRVVAWRGMPVAIVHRSPSQIAALSGPLLTAELQDPHSEARQQPGLARNPTRSEDPRFGVLIGICTHLGCLPNFREGELVAWLCPCHGSKFDLAGRVLKGSPARYNLPVPPYRQQADTVILGDTSLDPAFTLDQVHAL